MSSNISARTTVQRPKRSKLENCTWAAYDKLRDILRARSNSKKIKNDTKFLLFYDVCVPILLYGCIGHKPTRK